MLGGLVAGEGSFCVTRVLPPFVDGAPRLRFTVRSLPDLLTVIVPFMDEHLPASYKRSQYLAWRTALLARWEHGAKRRRACTVEACGEPRRAKGLCRGHYYRVFGR